MVVIKNSNLWVTSSNFQFWKFNFWCGGKKFIFLVKFSSKRNPSSKRNSSNKRNYSNKRNSSSKRNDSKGEIYFRWRSVFFNRLQSYLGQQFFDRNSCSKNNQFGHKTIISTSQRSAANDGRLCFMSIRTAPESKKKQYFFEKKWKFPIFIFCKNDFPYRFCRMKMKL